MGNELVMTDDNKQVSIALSPTAVKAQVGLIQTIMREVMQGPTKENPGGVHYGIIPGCVKPSLLKAGAEKLALTFQFRLSHEKQVIDLGTGHREYVFRTIVNNSDGNFLTDGCGSCSTMETKYRYRNDKKKCPVCGGEYIIKGKEQWGGGWLCYAARGGCGAKFNDGDAAIEQQKVGKIENPDIADVYNTVMKMAEKRADVDAIIRATSASDILTQDIEDMPDYLLNSKPAHTPVAAPVVAPAATPVSAPATAPAPGEMTGQQKSDIVQGVGSPAAPAPQHAPDEILTVEDALKVPEGVEFSVSGELIDAVQCKSKTAGKDFTVYRIAHSGHEMKLLKWGQIKKVAQRDNVMLCGCKLHAGRYGAETIDKVE